MTARPTRREALLQTLLIAGGAAMPNVPLAAAAAPPAVSHNSEIDRLLQAGLDAGRLFAALGNPDIKDRLRRNTEELIHRGGFGSPTLFVGGSDMYFGNDRLFLVREALRHRARCETGAANQRT